MKDALIVGMGLAGAALASQLEKQGYSFTIFDLPSENTASAVAAGVLNPVVLKRLNTVWKAAESYPFAISYYESLCQDHSWFKSMPIFKIFKSLSEENAWYEKMDDPFLGSCFQKRSSCVFGGKELKGALFTGSYILDTTKYLDLIRLTFSDCYVKQKFQDAELKFQNGAWEYNGESYTNMFDCRGNHHADLPGLGLFKGQYLELDKSVLETELMIKGSHFLVPKSDSYLVGATFSRSIGPEPEKEAKEELLNFLKHELSVDAKSGKDVVGFRPVAKDRRALVGEIAPQRFVLNGLGSRGIMLSPILAYKLIQLAFDDEPMWPELDPKRFTS